MQARSLCLLVFGCYLSRTAAFLGTPVARAVDPTTAGQIGVNPVTDEPAGYYESIDGVATKYYKIESSTTKWIGVNTEYLTELVETTTVNNVATTKMTSVPLIAATATAAANGLEAGAVTIIMSPALTDILDQLASEAVTNCLETQQKRQTCDVRHEFANLVNQNLQPGGNLVEFDFDFLIPTIAAEDVAAIVSGVTNALPILGIFVMSYLIFTESGAAKIAPVMNIPPSLTVAPTASATASGCAHPTATGENRIICPDTDCNGPNDDGLLTDSARLCTSGSYKSCPCVRTIGAVGDDGDQTWMDEQQTLLANWIDGDFSSDIPTCYNITSDGAWDNSNIVINDGATFCSGNSGSDVSKVSTKSFQDTWTYFDGTLATFTISAALGSGCGTTTISQSDCTSAIQSIMDDCPTGTTSNTQKYGGSIELNCQVYTVTPIKYTPCISTC